MTVDSPRLVIAGLSGDSGKTVVCLSLLSILRQKGLCLSVFKKGPDYIDAAWLSFVSDSSCRNLDTYMVAPEQISDNFVRAAAGSDISIIEGNRGLFDGLDKTGTHSTASLARLLGAPVVLVVDCHKVTRSLAAVINGCVAFDPDLRIAGVILNRVAGPRHEKIIRESIREYCDLPVLGAIPRIEDEVSLIPGRHLGLITPAEFDRSQQLRATLTEIGATYLGIDDLIEAARAVEPLDHPQASRSSGPATRVRVGVFEDSIFTFYYPENLEALEAGGAELVAVSSLEDGALPDVDALYIGGGFPETQADRLAANRLMCESVRKAATEGMPIYAECGGLIYLSKSLESDGRTYPMAGVFPLDLTMHQKPVGHGYTLVRIDRPNPFFEVGDQIKGHEFHYSGIQTELSGLQTCLSVERGVGLGQSRDGLLYKNTLACFTHIHAGGTQDWAHRLVSAAVSYKDRGACNPEGKANNIRSFAAPRPAQVRS
ncbi:MAG: cobyrinate a,c-diamide synthase [Candidatus Zixiibacteriota bacterium]|nr:MAG: cobyrinate a,c-diamide synthase [candidate division Zixibacteria bacterium]